MNRLRSHLTYANVMATLALFIALGGSSYAALRIGTKQVRNNSLLGEDIRNRTLRGEDVLNRTLFGRDLARNTVGGTQVRESSLGIVPNASRLDGVTASELKVRCPPGTSATGASCIEGASRTAATFTAASGTCGHDGRRLPSYVEMRELARTGGQVHPDGEWTSDVYRDPDAPGDLSDQLAVVISVPNAEGLDYRPAITPAPLPFRCVALPSN
jgi:hypothetical protein